jgi:hypothetical protein
MVSRLSTFLAAGMGNGMATGEPRVFAFCLLVYFTTLGFISGYLMTRLFLTMAISRAEREADEFIGSQSVDRILGVEMGEVREQMPPSLQKDVAAIAKRQLSDVEKPDDVWLWAKSKLLNNEVDESLRGFEKAIEMGGLRRDAKFLVEYSLALLRSTEAEPSEQRRETPNFAKAGVLLEEARTLASNVEAAGRRSIYKAVTYYYLYCAPPRGFVKARQAAEEYIRDQSNPPSPSIFINLACALGQQVRWLRSDHPATDLAIQLGVQPENEHALATRALIAIENAVRLDRNRIPFLRTLLVRNHPERVDPGENDLEAFADNPAFRRALFIDDF